MSEADRNNSAQGRLTPESSNRHLKKMLPGPKDISEPHKELRFTRGSQASLFAMLAAISGGASVAIVILNLLLEDPLVSWWWVLVPLPPAFICSRLCLHCIRHAYLILTPLGIEIFPFFKPQENLQILYWSQISDAEVNEHEELVIHLNEDQTSGVVASLSPLLPVRRKLLAHAIAGRMDGKRLEETPEGDVAQKNAD